MSDYPPETKYSKPYDHHLYEKSIYQTWLDSGYFNPDNLPERFTGHWSTIMPPPNANGRLHAGHGLDVALKDTFGRYYRAQGKRVLIVPGADHAGFETQVVYEKKLEKEGRSRFGMDPALLYQEIYDFTMENKQFMEGDLRSLGMSCDWSRNTFTLDPAIVTKVQESFIKLHEQGHVYRGKRISNWCSKHQTSLSDIETENKEASTTFYTFQYGPFQIGTVRPETKFADKYIIVHPDDARYSQYEHMQTFEVEWINGPITATLIKDTAADPLMGTGAMTITPWHSAVDFELARKYNLPMEQIIDESGKLLSVAGEFAGMKIAAARPLIVEKLRDKGLLVSEDASYKNVINCCYKCGTIIEPQVRDQWYVKMDYFCDIAFKASQSGEVTFVSDQFRKTFEYWMNNPMDWNISRQIVWGIGIPAWYRNKGTTNEQVHVGKEAPDTSGEWASETDTFDTWFSSGQWPLLTLGYPDSDDFKNYYPTNLMETGRDLIFKWVPRMIFLGKHFTGQVPFKTVYMHGMVNDEKNQKMSKSKGNVLSPIDLSEEFGTDALRMSLIIGMTPGNDTPLSKDKLRAQKKFANKLWNIGRFVVENTTPDNIEQPGLITEYDQQFIAQLNEINRVTSTAIETYALHLGAEGLYHFVWHELADKVIEDVKSRIKTNSTSPEALSGKYLLRKSIREILIMLHPFMPFITEEMWKDFGNGELLMIAQWPVSNDLSL